MTSVVKNCFIIFADVVVGRIIAFLTRKINNYSMLHSMLLLKGPRSFYASFCSSQLQGKMIMVATLRMLEFYKAFQNCVQVGIAYQPEISLSKSYGQFATLHAFIVDQRSVIFALMKGKNFVECVRIEMTFQNKILTVCLLFIYNFPKKSDFLVMELNHLMNFIKKKHTTQNKYFI